jgi:RNAse (barnase) inhibitor barstar
VGYCRFLFIAVSVLSLRFTATAFHKSWYLLTQQQTMVKQIEVEGNAIQDIASFYEEINRVFMVGENWLIGQSLDAFNDLLVGGYGALQGADSVDLVWHHMDYSRKALGYQTTREYYLEKLRPGSPYNKKLFGEKLAALESGRGETYFDTVLAVLAEHPNIKVTSQ